MKIERLSAMALVIPGFMAICFALLAVLMQTIGLFFIDNPGPEALRMGAFLYMFFHVTIYLLLAGPGIFVAARMLHKKGYYWPSFVLSLLWACFILFAIAWKQITGMGLSHLWT